MTGADAGDSRDELDPLPLAANDVWGRDGSRGCWSREQYPGAEEEQSPARNHDFRVAVLRLVTERQVWRRRPTPNEIPL